MLRCRDHQKEQITGANPLKPLTDGEVTFDPRVQGASEHGALPGTRPQIWVEAMTLRGSTRGVQTPV